MKFSAHYGESRQPAIDESLNRILDETPNATGLIVHNDASVAVLPAVLHSRGVKVPDDLSVVSLYSKDFARSFSLPYTAVESSPDKLGRLAVERLTRRIQNPGTTDPSEVRFIAAELVDRGSTR
jgi:DNA-binding LacI/PurR family transcriptional regulator